MDILLTTLGSRGDLNPFLSLGVNLKRRGHRVTVITSEVYRPVVALAGLNFISCHSAEDFYEVQNHPDLYDSRKGFQILAKHLMLGTMRKVYQIISEYSSADTLLISSQFLLGTRLANEKLGLPLVTLALQPAAFWSVKEPSINPGMLFLSKLPFFLRKLILNKVDKDYLDKTLAPELNRFRQELKLPAINKIYSHWIFSPLKIMGLFPEWFAKPALDWPANTQLTGFINYDENAQQPVPEQILNFLNGGESPVILTYGTANTQSEFFFQTLIAAGRRLNLRLLILTQYPQQLPALRFNRECQAAYVSLPTVLPRVKAIVHHGGIGTTAQALAAAVPQLIVPFAYDQFDNAVKLEKIGAGISLISKKSYSVERAAKALEDLLTSEAIKSQCSIYSKKIDFAEAERLTCEIIETC